MLTDFFFLSVRFVATFVHKTKMITRCINSINDSHSIWLLFRWLALRRRQLPQDACERDWILSFFFSNDYLSELCCGVKRMRRWRARVCLARSRFFFTLSSDFSTPVRESPASICQIDFITGAMSALQLSRAAHQRVTRVNFVWVAAEPLCLSLYLSRAFTETPQHVALTDQSGHLPFFFTTTPVCFFSSLLSRT